MGLTKKKLGCIRKFPFPIDKLGGFLVIMIRVQSCWGGSIETPCTNKLSPALHIILFVSNLQQPGRFVLIKQTYMFAQASSWSETKTLWAVESASPSHFSLFVDRSCLVGWRPECGLWMKAAHASVGARHRTWLSPTEILSPSLRIFWTHQDKNS